MYANKNVKNNVLLFITGTLSAGFLCILLHHVAALYLPLWLCFIFCQQWAAVSMYFLMLMIQSDCNKVKWMVLFTVLVVLLARFSLSSISLLYISSLAWLLPLIGFIIGGMLGIFVYACCRISAMVDGRRCDN